MNSLNSYCVDIMKKPFSGLQPVLKSTRLLAGAGWLLLACQLGATESERAAAGPGPLPDSVRQQPVPAAPVDLEKPLPEAKPLSIVAEDGAPAVAVPAAKASTPSKTITQARSVDLGEPLPAALPLQVVGEPAAGKSAAVGTAEAESAGDDPVTRQPSVDPVPAAREQQAGPASEQEAVAEVAVSPAPADSGKKKPVESGKAADSVDKAAPSKAKSAKKHGPFVMLGAEVAPGTSTRLAWSPNHSFEGIAVATPVLVVNGTKPGPVLCLTAAVHGDELNGIEIVRRVLYNLDAAKLSGTVVGVPIVNLQGFRRGSRYLPDRRDLNRFFPGDPKGSSAARIAYSFFHQVIDHCDALVDLHTGSFYRTNLPQLRADLRDPEVLELSQGFDGTVVLQSEGTVGTLRQAAVAAGIPAVTLEAGEPLRLQENEVNHGVKTIQSLLGKMHMIKKTSFWGTPEPVYYQSVWVRADEGGILFSEVDLGERVKEKEILGTVTDPITNIRTEILSPYQGRVLGMALNQVVMPGFAAFRIGIQSSEEEVIDAVSAEAETPSALHTSQVEKAQEEAVPEPAPAEGSYEDFEGLEDSE
jgi:predicted deacylase